MSKLIWAALAMLPLAIAGGLGYANSHRPQPTDEPYICPLTGEELLCPNCCPLNWQQETPPGQTPKAL
jgi:hypothetical protein